MKTSGQTTGIKPANVRAAQLANMKGNNAQNLYDIRHAMFRLRQGRITIIRQIKVKQYIRIIAESQKK
jgi:hypothetical protein